MSPFLGIIPSCPRTPFSVFDRPLSIRAFGRRVIIVAVDAGVAGSISGFSNHSGETVNRGSQTILQGRGWRLSCAYNVLSPICLSLDRTYV